jgi:hypothetical protein
MEFQVYGIRNTVQNVTLYMMQCHLFWNRLYDNGLQSEKAQTCPEIIVCDLS